MPNYSMEFSIVMCMTIIGRIITIWDKVFFKFRVSFDVMVSREKVLSESFHRIETYLDVVVEFIYNHISVSF